jgi:hypothetical protein
MLHAGLPKAHANMPIEGHVRVENWARRGPKVAERRDVDSPQSGTLAPVNRKYCIVRMPGLLSS